MYHSVNKIQDKDMVRIFVLMLYLLWLFVQYCSGFFFKKHNFSLFISYFKFYIMWDN